MEGRRRVTRRDQLELLARAIRRAHAAAEIAAGDSTRRAHEVGRLLLDAKAQLGHGAFMPWVAMNCQIAQRTANLYMRIATEWKRVEANWQSVASLGLGALERWLASQRVAESSDVSDPRGQDFSRRYRTVLNGIEACMQPSRRESGYVSLLPHLDRLELYEVRDALSGLSQRIAASLATVDSELAQHIDLAAEHADAHVTAEACE